MGFFDKPLKAIKGAVNKFIPGGKYLTGAAAERQKRLYNEAQGKYNNYAAQAQNHINTLSQNLQHSMQNLQSLAQQKELHSVAGSNLHSKVNHYQRALSSLEQQKSAASLQASHLEKAAQAFKAKAPMLANKISEIEKLPSIFENLYTTVVRQKEQLKGFNEEEAANLINKHKSDVENLKKERQEIEDKIRTAMQEITAEHSNLGQEKANLEQSLERYKYQQDRLLHESNSFQQQQNVLQKVIQDYKAEQDRINNAYLIEEGKVRAEETSLQNYIKAAQSELDSIGEEVQFRARKYKRDAKDTGLAQGGVLALGGLALGTGLGSLAGSSGSLGSTVLGGLGTGLKYAAPMLGITRYLNSISKGQKLNGFEPIRLGTQGQQVDLANIARYGLGGSKVAIPELGGLKQSLEHFNIPIIPKLRDLPQLHETLGKIASIQDIESLGLGLPSMTSASGKKYSTEVLYNPDFIRKLRKVSRTLGVPYLKPSFRTNMGISSLYG